MRTRRWHVSLICGAGFLLAACTMQVNTNIAPGGSGEMLTEFGFSQTDRQMLEGLQSSPEKFCEDMRSNGDLPEGAALKVEERGDEVWCSLAVSFASLPELQSIYGEMRGVTVNSLAIEGEHLVYDLDVNLSEGQSSEFGDFDTLFRWQVTMPGQVLDHNADEAKGSTLTWNLGAGGSVNIRATSTASGDGVGPDLGSLSGTLPAILLGVCCCGLLLAGGGGAAFALSRRNQGEGGMAGN